MAGGEAVAVAPVIGIRSVSADGGALGPGCPHHGTRHRPLFKQLLQGDSLWPTAVRIAVPAPMKTPSSDKPAPQSTKRAPRRRVAIGPPRPQYLLNEENDRMMMIITALAAEVSALRDRLDTHEALAEQGQFPATEVVEKFRLDTTRQAKREQARQQMLSRVFRIVLEDLDGAREADQLAAKVLLDEQIKAT